MNKKRLRDNIVFMILLFGTSLLGHASTPPIGSEMPTRFIFYFANNSSLLMRDYYTNQSALAKLDEILKDPYYISKVDSISIFGSASLIGNFQINSRLSYERAMALRTYIRWKHPGIYNDRISVLPSVFDWNVLIDLVQNDPLVPHREEVLKILNSPSSNHSKVDQIKQLGNGSTDTYMARNFARYMRTATSVFFYIKEEVKKPEVIETPNDTIPIIVEEIEEVITEEQPEVLPPIISPQLKKYRPLFAVKTNLLYDLLSGLNIEVEVPIGKHFSLAGEWIFPWWLWEKKQYALEILNGNLEFRYWWGNHTKDNLLTGWFTGVYGGGGLYDVEWKTKGYQGEFIIPFGLTGGFAHKISKNWRMEYSLGVGYVSNNYRKYVPQKCEYDDEWHLIKQKSGKTTWIGPTRAKVSLVWMINSRHNKK